jgi:hypothetical protein
MVEFVPSPKSQLADVTVWLPFNEKEVVFPKQLSLVIIPILIPFMNIN